MCRSTTRTGVVTILGLALAGAVGCSAPVPSPRTVTAEGAPHRHDPGDHNHARGKMLLASDGTYNALLTAHLSAKDGNELDIFVEDKNGPFALAAKTLTATARAAGGEPRALTFECAPPNERPAAEAPDTCSHYVAKAPWVRVGQVLRVETSLTVGERTVPMLWRDFEARKYAHHED